MISTAGLTLFIAGIALGGCVTYLICRTLLGARLEAVRVEARMTREHAADVERRLKEAIDSLCAEALRQNNAQFLTLARTELERVRAEAAGDLDQKGQAIAELLAPIRDGLASYDNKISEIELARERSFGEIALRLQQVGEASELLKGQTQNLIDALKSPGVRGRWGEVQLRRVCELAGMLAHCDFDEQVTVDTGDGAGARQRPDLVVRLAGGRSIVVDAKVPLDAYLAAYHATDENARREQLRRHARQIRAHIEQLARKAYWEQFVPAPEFVVLFLPGEVFFSAALQEDSDLLEAGAADKVLLATPTTLIALLRTAAAGWRQESVAQSAEEIGRLARELFDRIAKVGELYGRVGDGLEKAVRAYNEGVGSLETRLLVTARRLNAQGVFPAQEIGIMSPIEVAPRALQAPELLPESLGGDGAGLSFS